MSIRDAFADALCQQVSMASSALFTHLEVRAACEDIVSRIERAHYEDRIYCLERSIRVSLAALDNARTETLKLEAEKEHLSEQRKQEKMQVAAMLSGMVREVSAAQLAVSRAQRAEKTLTSRNELCRAMKRQ